MSLFKKISILLVVMLVVSYFIPIQNTQKVNIKKPFYAVVTEINNPDSWRKWYAPIQSSYQKHPHNYRYTQDYKNKTSTIYTHNNTFVITKYSPGLITIDDNLLFKTQRGVNIAFTKTGDCVAMETCSTSLLGYLFNFFTPDNQKNHIIKALKKFMETPALYYGFEIKKTKVPDTLYIMLSKTVGIKHRFKVTDSLFKNLTQYAFKNKLTTVFKPYLVASCIGKDSVQLTTMLVIDKPDTQYGKIKTFTMPSVGNILVTHYKGPYGDAKAVYEAMQKYVSDNNFSGVFTPFEKYLNKQIPKKDSSIVDMEVYYPIY